MLGTERFLQNLQRGRPAAYGALRFHECVSSADLIARQLRLGGPALAFSTACSGSALAIAAAAELVANNEADVVLAGGCDSLSRLTLNGFGSLLLLDPQGCRPFDARRAGISIGEGAAVLVLEAEETAVARGAKVLAELSGWGMSCDAYHATAPQSDGEGAWMAMHRALENARLIPADIDYVNAHGTGTLDNDFMEGRAMRRLFGDRLPPLSSTKRFFGHTLGASGAIKAAVGVLALVHQGLPPNPGFGEVDPEIGIEPVRSFRPATVRHVMSNSFGFGGNNVVLVFSKPPTPVAGHRVPAVFTAPDSRTTEPLAIVAGCGVAPAENTSTFDTPAGAAQVLACGDFGAEKELSPARRRRLSRLQQMTLVAAKRCVPAGVLARFQPEQVCVAIGTGLGSLNEAAAFVENMWRKDEAEPLPQRFTNSVHNALAAQVAIELGLKGLNSTPTCHEVSFETALWHATRELCRGTSKLALAGAADELNRYAVAAGMRWRQRILPGEGAAVFCLAVGPFDGKPLGRLHSIRLGRSLGDVEAEANWLADELPISELDGLVTDRRGAVVAESLRRLVGRKIPVDLYTRRYGEHPSASAFGFLAALDLIRSGARRVALYTLSPYGQKALCLLGN